jgi:molybdate transport system substrate-binding protein
LDRGSGFRRRAILALLLGVAFLSPCAAHPAEIPTVFAAASLTAALTEVMEGPAAAEGLQARLVFGASSTLARQIAAGAPADLYLSASTEWMDYLEQEGLVAAETRVDLLAGALVLIAPRGEGFSVEWRPGVSLARAFVGRLALADPDHVPAGVYARQALTHLGWWDGLRQRLAPAQDVRAALAFVERGECGTGIVYATDALANDRVELLGRFPADSHDPILYPLAAIRGRDTPAVRRLLAFLQSTSAIEVFARRGFAIPPRSAALSSPDSGRVPEKATGARP